MRRSGSCPERLVLGSDLQQKVCLRMAASDGRRCLFPASGFQQLTNPAMKVLVSQLRASPAYLPRAWRMDAFLTLISVSSGTPSLQTTGISLSRPWCFWKISCYLTAKLNQSSRESQQYCPEAISDSWCSKRRRVALRRNVCARTYPHNTPWGWRLHVCRATAQFNALCFSIILCYPCWSLCSFPLWVLRFSHAYFALQCDYFHIYLFIHIYLVSLRLLTSKISEGASGMGDLRVSPFQGLWINYVILWVKKSQTWALW